MGVFLAAVWAVCLPGAVCGESLLCVWRHQELDEPFGCVALGRVCHQHCGVRERALEIEPVRALLAREVDADLFVIATDVAGVYLDWGTPGARLVRRASPQTLSALRFAAGSM